MPETIRDGKGRGYLAEVDREQRLKVFSTNISIQNYISEFKDQAYQVIGTATLSSGTTVALHIKNTSSDKDMLITYLRHQVIDPAGGTALPNASNYYRLALGRTYSSGGSTATPVNCKGGSGNAAEVVAYQGGPTLAGTALELDRWYTKDEADMNNFNKEGAVILPPSTTLELSYVGDQTSGTLYTRLSFLMEDQ